MTANQLAYDRTMDRVAMLDSYERGILKKLDITIDQHFSDTLSILQDPRLGKADPHLISELLERQRGISKGNIKNILERSLRDLANDQVAYQVNSIDKIVGKFWNTQQPGKSLDITTLEGYFGKTIDSRVDSIFAKERLKIERLVRTSLGKDISTALEKSKVKNYLKNEIKTLGITSTTSTTVSADFLVFNANKGILKGWQYFAILDLSTSRICRFRAGRVFHLDQTEMYPPAHPNCRSKPLMIFKSLSELSDEESPQVRKRNLIKANRSDFSKFSGEIIRGHSYNDWLKKQPFIIKLKQLGSQTAVNAVEQGKLLAHDVFNAKGDTIGITTLRKLTADNLVPGTVSQFTTAKEKLDALRLAAATPDDFLKDEELKRNLKTYYLLQNGELNGTLSLTNYRGQLIGTKAATKRRVLNSPPTDDQQIFNPFTNRYEDARLYRPNPAVLENAKRLVTTSEELLSKDKLFITEVVDSLSDKMGTNERAVVSDNLRILFERYRRNREPWLNFKAVAQSQIKFDVMNISESLETRVRSDSDFLKKFSQSVYLDPILGDIQLQDLHDSFISNILARNKWEDKTAPRIAEKLRSVFDSKIPLILRSRLSDSDLQQFYLKFAHRLSLADGPDRDQFAVQLGRDLYNLANLNGDKNSWFTTGRDLLESRNVNKFFEIDTFGIQKRRLKSKLSGKYFGPYYDTISYNIRVTDPQILEYSRLNRKIDVGLRVGVLSDKNRLVFRPGYKTYFIDRGVLGLEDTRIPITSTSSFSEFPEELIDKSLADALNWAATAKYKIDPIFYNFVKKLLYFRDDKGKAEHFNDLNVLKKYLVARGDAYERFKAMDWLAAKNEAFSNQPFVDHRLRIYDRGLISPQSGETFRPFLNTADLKPLGTEGFETLMDQAGAFLGGLDDYFEGNYNSLTVSGRQGVFKKWQEQLIILGNHIIRGKPDDIRQILESEFTSRIDGEELGKLYRLSLEIAKVDNYLKTGNPLENKGAAVIYSRKTLAKLDKYLTDFAIEQDASSSGAQIIALTTRNKALAELSNVVPTSQKRRLYDEIAARTFRDPEFMKLNEKLGFSEKDLRKASKAQNMVTFYGAGERTSALNVEAKLSKILDKEDGVLVLKASERDKILDEISARAARYRDFDTATFEELQLLRKRVKVIFDEGLEPGDDLLDQLYFLDTDSKALIDKLSANYDKVVTPSDFQSIAKIMSKHLADEVPITKEFTKFLGGLAAIYLENAVPAKSNFDWVKIATSSVLGERKKGFTLSDRVSRLLGLKANETLSEKVLKRFGFWEPNGTLANIILGENSAKYRRTGAKYLKTELLQLKELTSLEIFTANKLPKAWTNVPSVNFDGKVIEQNFTQVFESRLNYKDSEGNWVKNILQIPERTSATWWEQVINKSGKINDVADLAKAKTAFAVNANHANDATLVKNFHLWGRKNKISTATVHDAFFTNIVDIVKARKGLRELYAKALDSNIVKKTLDEMRARGLPDAIYYKKLDEAIEIGLIPIVGKTKIKGRLLREEDLLHTYEILYDSEKSPYHSDFNWYGIG